MMKTPTETVLSENFADMPVLDAVQRCARDLVSGGAAEFEVFEALLSVGLAGKMAIETPMEVARHLHATALTLLGTAALNEARADGKVVPMRPPTGGTRH
jgi:hypothetical protein